MSFETIVKRISPKLKLIAHRLNGHHTFFNDEDLYQEALLQLWVNFKEGNLDDKNDSYILKGCYFHLKNYLRKNLDEVGYVSIENPIGNDEYKIEDMLCSEEVDIYRCLEEKIDFDRIEEAYLDERERNVLSMLIEGNSMREIGKRLNISHVMVIKIKNRIKEKCKPLFLTYAAN
ncbi:MAG: sigma-70 family RNA polymerase sigma factor [Syntrophorhabdaceae bacterium]|nr:sigma-70 family RNA polymerase sigma factor [Syntrophorhabdaceae bacterium]